MYSHPLSPVYIYMLHISPFSLSLSLSQQTPTNSLQSQGTKRKGNRAKKTNSKLTELGLDALLALPDAHARERDADLPELAPGPGVRVAGALARGADGHFALSVACSSPKRPPPEMLAKQSINQSINQPTNQPINQSINQSNQSQRRGDNKIKQEDKVLTRHQHKRQRNLHPRVALVPKGRMLLACAHGVQNLLARDARVGRAHLAVAAHVVGVVLGDEDAEPVVAAWDW